MVWGFYEFLFQRVMYKMYQIGFFFYYIWVRELDFCRIIFFFALIIDLVVFKLLVYLGWWIRVLKRLGEKGV